MMVSILIVGTLFLLSHGNGQDITPVDNKCGVLSIDDIPATHTKVPWTAIIYLRTESQPDRLYAGSILSPQMILTYANILLSDGDLKLHIFPYSNYEARTNTTLFTEIITPGMQRNQITHIRIHPNFTGIHQSHNWTTSLDDLAIVHLQNPITFDSQVHSVCLPTITQMQDILDLWENSPISPFILISGWKRHLAEGVVLRMSANKEAQCKEYWYGDDETRQADYTDRICANVSSENAHTDCVNRDTGVFIRIDNQFYMAGFVNNFNSDDRVCTKYARYVFSHFTPSSLNWIEQNERCGPHNFTCTNGDCIPLEGSLCNRIPECADASDEDPHYCRGINYCNINEFPCGVYGKCIDNSLICDGKDDCEEGEDEMNCLAGPSALLPVLLAVLAVGILTLTLVAFLFWKRMKTAQEKLRHLTDEEVEEFEHGSLVAAVNINQVNNSYENSLGDGNMSTQFAWDAPRFEIPKKNLNINKEKPLGNGIAGTVYPAVFCKDDSNSDGVDVAVKMFNESADTQNFKALLSELKIMTRITKHENIVNLIGAYTREIKQRIVYVVVELCGMGDLEGYLKNNRNAFVNDTNTTKNNEFPEIQTSHAMHYVNVEDGNPSLTTQDLIRWSYEIASGMEHLASLNITHGDLATRNILLTTSFSAKISDFGLARNLYETGIYVKKEEAMLPWRWMAIESLRDFEFSSRSDAWAYGVTIWEIFSLGGVPYPGLSWTLDFLKQLVNGLRMTKPSYASQEVYNIMTDCWKIDSTHRPTFTQLKLFFHNYEENLQTTL